MNVDWEAAVKAQEQKLMTMPLNATELHILSQIRRSIYTYATMLGIFGFSSGYAMSPRPLRPISFITIGGFGFVGSFLGVALGMQRALLKLDHAANEDDTFGLVFEWHRLGELKRQMKNNMPGLKGNNMEQIFRQRTASNKDQ